MSVPFKGAESDIPDVANSLSLQQQLASKKGINTFLKQYPDVNSFLNKRKLKKTTINISRATSALRAEKQADSLPLGRDISTVSSDAPRQVIYGTARIGGVITFIDAKSNNQYLDLVISLAGHEIESIEKLFLDDAQVIFQTPTGTTGQSDHLLFPDGTTLDATNKIYMQTPTGYITSGTGTDSQGAINGLYTDSDKWTSAHRQRGVAIVYVRLQWDALIFGDGLPDISFEVKGAKVYDPRTPATVYSTNAALIIADYLTNTRYGLGIDYAKLDEDSLIAAADVCDEAVTLADASTEARYTINGAFSTSESFGRILERMAAAFGGSITYSNGLWKFWPAAWRSPSITFTEDDFRSSIKMQTMATREDIFNAVHGVHVSALNNFVEGDYPLVKNDSYATLDGEQIIENIDYHFVTSAPTCQRLAKIELEKIRQGIQLQFEASLKAYQLEVGDVVAITFSRYGWTAKTFEVMECHLIVSENGSAPEITVGLSLKETAEGIFDWNDGEETTVDLAPNTNLPSPFSVGTISGLALSSGTSELYMRGDGTIAPRVKVSWTAVSDYFVTSGGFVMLQYKKSADSDWTDFTLVPASSTFAYVTDVNDGVLYDFRARLLNSFRATGDWTTIVNYLVVGKTEKPSNVSSFTAQIHDFGILLQWAAITDLDVSYYEIQEGSSWDIGSVLGQPKTTSLNLNIRTTGTYTFLIKAVDTTGNYSTTATSVSVTILAQSIASGMQTLNGPNVVLDWADASGGAFSVNDYVISYGTVYASSTFVSYAKVSQYSVRANWSGLRKFWIAARDVYGNIGTPFSFDVTITPPSLVASFSVKIIDNNVLLSWSASAVGTLPVDHYKVYKGATFGAAVLIGQTAATYTTYFEVVSGDYVYWVVPVDSAGNVGTEKSVAATVDQPADFILQSQASLVLASAGTLTNCFVDADGSLILPVNKTETWTEHFVNNSFATPQAQIDAGYPIFLQPSPSTATYVQTHDIGSLITGGSLVTFSYTDEVLSAGITLTPTVSVSPDNSAWTDHAGVLSVFESNFRYVKITLAATGGGDASLHRLKTVDVVISVKLKRDSGSVSAIASDTSGTTVTFNKTFYDIVGAPQVTPTEIVRAAENWSGSTYLTAGDVSDFEPGDTDFTIAGWVKYTTLNNAVNTAPHIFGKWDVNQEYIAYLDATTGSPAWIINDGSSNKVLTAANAGRIAPGVWYFVAFYHDSVNNLMGIKVNKQAVNTVAHTTGVRTGTRTSAFEMMARSAFSDYPTIGQMRNWGFWKGRVVSSADLDTLCDIGFEKYANLASGFKTNLNAYWEMGETSGTRVDSVGNHNLTQGGTLGSRVLPLQGMADFTDAANPTNFKALVFTDSQVRVSAAASWYADGYTDVG